MNSVIGVQIEKVFRLFCPSLENISLIPKKANNPSIEKPFVNIPIIFESPIKDEIDPIIGTNANGATRSVTELIKADAPPLNIVIRVSIVVIVTPRAIIPIINVEEIKVDN